MSNKDNIWNSKRVKFEDTAISDDDKYLIDKVVDKFADYSATDLVSLTQNNQHGSTHTFHIKIRK